MVVAIGLYNNYIVACLLEGGRNWAVASVGRKLLICTWLNWLNWLSLRGGLF